MKSSSFYGPNCLNPFKVKKRALVQFRGPFQEMFAVSVSNMAPIQLFGVKHLFVPTRYQEILGQLIGPFQENFAARVSNMILSLVFRGELSYCTLKVFRKPLFNLGGRFRKKSRLELPTTIHGTNFSFFLVSYCTYLQGIQETLVQSRGRFPENFVAS